MNPKHKYYESPKELDPIQPADAYRCRDHRTGEFLPRCWRNVEWSEHVQCTKPAADNAVGLCTAHYEEVKKKYGVFDRRGERGEETGTA